MNGSMYGNSMGPAAWTYYYGFLGKINCHLKFVIQKALYIRPTVHNLWGSSGDFSPCNPRLWVVFQDLGVACSKGVLVGV